VIAKYLRYIAGEWYCQCKDSIAPLNGVVVALVVGVVPADGPVHCGQIANNAVSQMSNTFMSGSTSNGTTAVPVVNRIAGTGNITTSAGSQCHITVNADVPTVTCNASITGFNISFRILKNGVTTGAQVLMFSHLTSYYVAGGIIAIPPFILDFVDPSPGTGAVSYNLGVSVTPFGAGGTVSVTTSGQMILKEIKK
jgi:hypothetical protein